MFGFIFVIHHAKRDLMGIAKTIDPGQPEQSGQADHGKILPIYAVPLKLSNRIGLCLLRSPFYYLV